ncbi:MAG: S24 family peptidase [Thiothrix sp.]|nr:S24 family peptidase [Thiothrix sp.]HPQ95627.1 S24 family peptidase [Thiolinea sp.]
MREQGFEQYTSLASAISRELGDDIISQNIHNWCNRDNVPVNYLFALCKILKCSPEWMSTGRVRFFQSPVQFSSRQCVMPIHKQGVNGEKVSRNTLTDALITDREWFREAIGTEPSSGMMLINISQDTMIPTFNPGDIVLVDTDFTAARDGLAYVEYDGLVEVKRISIGSDAVMLIADNPHYPAKQVPKAELKIIGYLMHMFQGRRL